MSKENLKTVQLHLPHPIKLQINSPILSYSDIESLFLTGKKKHELTSWWLELIETEVDRYLEIQTFTFEDNQTLKFDLHAVPYNYLDHPPKSLAVIKVNLFIIQKLLSTHTNLLTQGLVLPLSKEIYHKIDDYERQIQNILLVTIKATQPQPHTKQTFVEWASQQLKQQQSKLSESKQTQLEGLIQDLMYISKMRELESHFGPNNLNESDKPNQQTKDKKPSDIVPVAGLITGRFHRIENELKTVLQHWGRTSL